MHNSSKTIMIKLLNVYRFSRKTRNNHLFENQKLQENTPNMTKELNGHQFYMIFSAEV